MLNAPENTLAAFKAAFSDGADAVECDIRRTADGQFVAFHDALSGRVCGHNWKIAETSWPHLKSLRVLGKEPIPHLDDILNLMILRPAREFYFEMALEKEADAADLALQIKRAGVQSRAFLLAFSRRRKFLAAARAAVPGIGLAVMPLFLPICWARRRRPGPRRSAPAGSAGRWQNSFFISAQPPSILKSRRRPPPSPE